MAKKVNQELLARQTKITKVASYYSIALVTGILLLVYFVLNVKEYLPHILLFFIVGMLINIFVFRFHKSTYAMYMVTMLLSYVTIMGVIWVTGGVKSHFMFVLTALPIAAFITSRKHGRKMLVVAVASVLAVFVAELLGAPTINIVKEAYHGYFAIVACLFVISLTSVLAWLMTQTSFKVYKAKDLLEQKNEIIKEKNRQIVDSMNYAKRIQEAMLTSGEYFKEVFQDHFILYKPKDVVSGDFYWAYRTKGDKVIWTASDCTGHGVPGAFMSMIGISLLNEVVVENNEEAPNKVLDKLSSGLIKALKQNREGSVTKDGMDMSLCVWDKKSNTLRFSAAYNPLYIIRDKEIISYKGNRQAIGYNNPIKKVVPFEEKTIELKKGDRLYVMTDGYVDQKGGPKGKKFLVKRLKNLLVSICEEPMEKQKEILEKKFYEWQGDYEQIDDICVIGVKV